MSDHLFKLEKYIQQNPREAYRKQVVFRECDFMYELLGLRREIEFLLNLPESNRNGMTQRELINLAIEKSFDVKFDDEQGTIKWRNNRW